MRNMDARCSAIPPRKSGRPISCTEYVLDLLGRFQLSDDDLFRCFDLNGAARHDAALHRGIWSVRRKCRSYGLPALSRAADLTNHALLNAISGYGLPLICSTGMSTEDEIVETARLLQRSGASYVFLHCNSTYPAPFKDINLRYMHRLSELVQGVVGYSGHERDIFVAIAAVAMDARIIEKHFTVDRNLEGNDHKVSLLPDEFARMVEGIRQIEEAEGTGNSRIVTQGEKSNRVVLGKSIFARVDIAPGTVIDESMITVRSPGEGIPAQQAQRTARPSGCAPRSRWHRVLSLRSLRRGLTANRGKTHRYDFDRPWGIPVRHRDVGDLLSVSEPGFVEFHLSYRDMEKLEPGFDLRDRKVELVVHAPELFRGDHVLDLCSLDNEYLLHSMGEMRRVIEFTKRLSDVFKVAAPVGIITNVGGFSLERALTESECADRRAILAESLGKLRDPAVEIWPQTMPPFPWHFGGQRFHNLFRFGGRNRFAFCKALSLRVCLDTFSTPRSRAATGRNRSMSSSNRLRLTPRIFTLPTRVASMATVRKVGEAVRSISKTCSASWTRLRQGPVSFPKSWQGHENQGEGFGWSRSIA